MTRRTLIKSALGAGGEDWRSTTDSLTQTGTNEFCLSMSKLNVFQCLAASRPYYEDMFCIGRHVIGDIGRCTAQSAGVLAPNIDLPAEPTLVSAPETGPAPVTAAGADPIVVIGTTGDPATPHEWSVALAEQLESGVLVTYEGEGHTAYGRAGQCITGAVDSFLLEGTVPEDGLVC